MLGFSVRKARYLIQLADTYGNENSQHYKALINRNIYSDLEYSKALRLMNISEDEINDFVKNTEIEKLNVKELEDEIKKFKTDDKEIELKKIETSGKSVYPKEDFKNILKEVIRKLSKIDGKEKLIETLEKILCELKK